MGKFPFFVELEGKRGVIVGGGRVAARKVEKLLEFGPGLTVIGPEIEESILSREGQVAVRQRAFRMEDLEGADFVIAATDSREINRRVSAYCRERRIPVNTVDDRENCTFYFPALVKDGPLTVGISTDGRSPVAASWVREQVAGVLPQGLGDIIDLLGQVRPWVLESGGGEQRHREILERMFYCCLEKTRAGGQVTAEELRSMI